VVLLTSDSKVTLSKVQLGRNLGREVEVLSGLSPDAAVIDSPSESLITGQAVSIARKNGDKADTDLRHGRPET
jgi:hypothetical protein